MTGLALFLILAAAFIHASWNFLLKRSGGGNAFVWLFGMLSAALYAPIAAGIIWWQQIHFGWQQYGFMAASAAIHTAYYMLLDRGYRSGEFSLVYPMARGTGPLITMLVAVLLLNEQPGPIAIGGGLLVGIGAFLLTGDPRKLRESGNLHAVGFALLTGCTIASYTLVDKLAVAVWLIPPLVQDWATNLGRVILMTPLALKARAELAPTWRRAWREIVGVAILCPLSYILVLTAMVFTPVSYVAPAREISILIGALMGARLLQEGNISRRMIAASAMVCGVVCLALG